MIEIIFFAVGLIILLGFFSHLFFEKTKIPDVLILMSVGVILNQSLDILDPAVFITFAPYVGALALVMILFDGGINLKFKQVIKQLPSASGFTVAVFALTSFFIMLVMNLFFNWDLLHALLLGVVIGGTSSAIVISVVSKLCVDDYVKIILTLESTLTDAICIISAITIVGVISSGSADPKSIVNSIFAAFSIATLAAFVFGIIWIKILARFHKMPFGYLLTVAVIFILYAIVEFSGGNGAIAAFVFGLMLGNSIDIAGILKINRNIIMEEKIRSFHEEVSFFTRTFFFIYLGLIFDPKILNESIILMSLAVLAAAILARFMPTAFLLQNKKDLKNCGILIVAMMPRGLAAAVLASAPEITGVFSASDAKSFTAIVILTVVFTNILATVGSFLYEKRRPKNCDVPIPEKTAASGN
jgi:cell volume regulation protein A